MENPFSQQTVDFMWDLRFNNEKPWFEAHRADYEAHLNRPMKELAAQTLESMKRRAPGMDWQMHISRIYRDARRLFGRGPYKERLWFCIWTGDVGRHGPMFWFEIGPDRYGYGVGYYDTTPEITECWRRVIDADPAGFERFADEFEKLGRYRVDGEEYKRPKADRGEKINRWYNRRRIGAEFSADSGGELFSPELPERLADSFFELMPVYDLLRRVYHTAVTEQMIKGKG